MGSSSQVVSGHLIGLFILRVFMLFPPLSEMRRWRYSGVLHEKWGIADYGGVHNQLRQHRAALRLLVKCSNSGVPRKDHALLVTGARKYLLSSSNRDPQPILKWRQRA